MEFYQEYFGKMRSWWVWAHVSLMIVNETPYQLQLDYCRKFGWWLDGHSIEGFNIEAPGTSYGHCFYHLNHQQMELFWNYDARTGQEYYGVTSVIGVEPWIRIEKPGHVQIYLH